MEWKLPSLSDSTFTRWLVIILLITLIIFGCLELTKAMAIVAGVIVFAVLALNLDKLKSLSAFGVKAEMKELIHEAEVTIAKLKEVAIAIADPVCDSLTLSLTFNRWPSIVDKVKQVHVIEQRLRELGCNSDEINKITGAFYGYVGTEYGFKILRHISIKNHPGHQFPIPMNVAEVEELIRQYADTPDNIGDIGKELLEDLRYFERTKEIRRPEIVDIQNLTIGR